MDLNTLKQMNKARWDASHIAPEDGPQLKKVADTLTANKSHYQDVADVLAKNGSTIPWWFIAVAHYREAGFDKFGQPKWDSYLGNGQPLNKKTTIVPKGRGPWSTWQAGAIDALVNAPPYAAQNADWSIGGALTMLEQYNGLGYANKNLPSPYIWSMTDQYVKGKYIADGKYDPEAVDKQMGCAGILKFMGVFKTAPTGSGTILVPLVAGAAATAAAAASTPWWTWFLDHKIMIAVTAIALGLTLDLCFAIYNNEKNQLKVSNVATN